MSQLGRIENHLLGLSRDKTYFLLYVEIIETIYRQISVYSVTHDLLLHSTQYCKYYRVSDEEINIGILIIYTLHKLSQGVNEMTCLTSKQLDESNLDSDRMIHRGIIILLLSTAKNLIFDTCFYIYYKVYLLYPEIRCSNGMAAETEIEFPGFQTKYR
ncbi:hypothetical protein BDB01DRAFT_835960 [Pilobolus umbonatus]|nr:hypothetical protein BDB01DRAFT_835960 [Pilobolus umbonatus]